MHAEWNLAALHHVGEIEIMRSVVDGVAAENDQQVNLAALHVGDEFLEGLCLVDRIGVDWVGVKDGLADVAELSIDRVGKGMEAAD